MGMVKRFALLLAVMLCLVFSPRPILAAESPLAGTYDTNFGALTIKVDGNQVTGTYPHDSGRIEGTLEGNRIVGKWYEAPTYAPPHDAGDFEFVFPSDFKSFAGKWRYGFGGKEWSGDWHGAKTNLIVGASLSGNWDTTFGPMALIQTGNKISATYTTKNGKIEGMIDGNIIKGVWSQAPSYKPPNEAGDFMFVVSADRNSFAGKYRFGFGGTEWTGNWTGTKLSHSGYEIVEGVYDTERGRLVIKQSGNKITGNYDRSNGRIEGTVEGKEIRGRWMEAPTYKPPKDAGEFKFTFSDDKKSFKGKWHQGFEEKEWKEDWNGKKAQ